MLFLSLKDQIVPQSCEHTFCKDCFQGYLRSKIEQADVLKILCPTPGCSVKMDEIKIKDLVPQDLMDKYHRFLKNAQLSLNPKVR